MTPEDLDAIVVESGLAERKRELEHRRVLDSLTEFPPDTPDAWGDPVAHLHCASPSAEVPTGGALSRTMANTTMQLPVELRDELARLDPDKTLAQNLADVLRRVAEMDFDKALARDVGKPDTAAEAAYFAALD